MYIRFPTAHSNSRKTISFTELPTLDAKAWLTVAGGFSLPEKHSDQRASPFLSPIHSSIVLLLLPHLHAAVWRTVTGPRLLVVPWNPILRGRYIVREKERQRKRESSAWRTIKWSKSMMRLQSTAANPSNEPMNCSLSSVLSKDHDS